MEHGASDFRSNAKIWHLYLEDAEREAKDRVELWKTSLDSLLIFAGLFAGIVASFLIDARHDLQPNSEQNLLTDIRSALRGMSATDTTIPASQKWVNALWLISLYITLFSAIMGVLAKAWLAKFVPFTTRREADDAYNRYKLDKEAEQWHLEDVITLVPLLVQVAAFLFLGGLIVQSSTDDRTLGWVLLGICLSGCCVYISMTILPLSFLSSPFNTPLSDLFRKIFTARKVNRSPTFLPDAKFSAMDVGDKNSVLADILNYSLIRSQKSTHVDEAAAEIGLPSFKELWIDYLCGQEAPQYLLNRFKMHTFTRTHSVDKKEAILCNYLLAFLRFVDRLEKRITMGSLDRADSKAQAHWLTLSLRATWPYPEDVNQYLKQEDTLSKLDFHPDEIFDRPWELVFQNIPSSHRLHFMLAACRGVLQENKNLKTTSTFILALSLAKAGWAASETGRTSEWEGRVPREDHHTINRLLQRLLSELYTALMAELDGMVMIPSDDGSSDSSLPSKFGSGATNEQPGILKALYSSLVHPTWQLHSIKMLNQAFLQGHSLTEEIPENTIVTIANMVVYSDSETRDGLNILANVLVNSLRTSESTGSLDQGAQVVMAALFESVQSGLKQQHPWQYPGTIKFIEILVNSPEHPLYALVKRFIPSLIEAALTNLPDISQPALYLVRCIFQDGDRYTVRQLRKEMLLALKKSLQSRNHHILPDLEGLLWDGSGWGKLSPYVFLWGSTNKMAIDVFPSILDEIVMEAVQHHSSTQNLSIHLLKQLLARRLVSLDNAGASVWKLRSLITQIGTLSGHTNVMEVVHLFRNQFVFDGSFLKTLFDCACHAELESDRNMSVSLISIICEERISTKFFQDGLRSTIQSYKEAIVKEPSSSICYCWVRLLNHIVKHG
ncbi:hypothetical protein MD484_g6737, partial [Candolleomyces efflorescens]